MNKKLSHSQIQQFIDEGYLRIDNAFSKELAKTCRDILWHDLQLDPNAPQTWSRPVIWLGMYSQEPFVESANTEILHTAFDQLVGKNNWMPCMSMGSFPVRFPAATDAGDTGWHVDAGFPGDDPSDFFQWRINARSKGRGLLMLFLFSDVGPADAPTRLRAGSHLDVAKLLSHEGETGLSFTALADRLHLLPQREEVVATGPAGTVYLCHPFLVHRAQVHSGTEPKFMAQPPLLLRHGLAFSPGDLSPVEQAISKGIMP